MVRRKIREYDAKKLLSKHGNGLYSFTGAFVEREADLEILEKQHPWIKKHKLVVKPDQLIGKKGKHDLILLNADWKEAKKYLKENIGKEVSIGKIKGKLKRFLIEPFVEHEEEYYVAMLTERECNKILFSLEGGVNIEENWDKVMSFEIPVGENADAKNIYSNLPSSMQEDKRKSLSEFLSCLHKFFVEQDCSYLEMNPVSFNGSGKLIPLGLVLELDRSAEFKHLEGWDEVEFPESFGKTFTKEERFVYYLDSRTGASLKLTTLNPKARVWLLVAGGGASVIYADTVADLGMGKELANYGEYSGNPSEEDTYYYAKTILNLMTEEKSQKKKVLIIGGGVANFTNVAATFKGIIRAIREQAEKLRENNIKIYVRRGGPNYEQGLELMKKLGEELALPIEVYGPETHMTKIVSLASEDINS